VALGSGVGDGVIVGVEVAVGVRVIVRVGVLGTAMKGVRVAVSEGNGGKEWVGTLATTSAELHPVSNTPISNITNIEFFIIKIK
jgi:hypothetical protein